MQKQVVLVDGSGYLFRAFHALPPLTNPDGQPTGAVFGVMNMMRRLEQDYHDADIVVVFDPPGPTKRHTIFPEYKANRSAMPDDLKVQIEPLHRLIRAKGYPLCIEPGHEADDVIGTLANRYVRAGYSVVICTGDKDFAQLVCDDIVLLDTMRDRLLTTPAVKDKFGVRPDQIIDYLALVGDTADNIPGVMKVGPKTAVKWLNEYDNIDTLVMNRAQIKGKIGDYLREAIDQLPLYQRLVTIDQNLDLSFDWQALIREPEDIAVLKSSYQQLGFRSWLKDLSDDFQVKSIAFELIKTDAELKNFLSNLSSDFPVSVSVYYESTLGDNTINPSVCAVAIGQKDHWAFVATCRLADHDEIIVITTVLQSLYQVAKTHRLVMHDAKPFFRCLLAENLSIPAQVDDIVVMAYGVQGPSQLSMPGLVANLLQEEMPERDVVLGKGAKRLSFSQMPVNVIATQLVAEAGMIEAIWSHISQNVWQENEDVVRLYRALDGPLIAILAAMEIRGALLDVSLLAQQSARMTTELSRLTTEAHELAGQEFNPASVKQLQSILFDQLGLPIVEKTPKGDPSTSEAALTFLAERFPLPKTILAIRSIAKLKSTYIDALPDLAVNDRVHCSFQQTVTATGRLSCQNPNLQNIPVRTEDGRAVRCAFISPDGFKLVAFDYSQIELRIMAHISKDPVLTEAFLTGQDIHNATAGELFSMSPDEVGDAERRVAKVINFGLIYGMSAFGLSKQLGVDRAMAQAYIDRYFQRYPGVKDYMARIREQASRDGYVETALGRKIFLPDIKHNKANIRKAAERAAINAPMQGTAAELIKLAMLEVDAILAKYPGRAHLIIQVHDELLFEVESGLVDSLIPKINQAMTSVLQLDVPLIVNHKVGDNWGDMS